ncbi:MAG TPA: hypothetical protein VIU64_01415 [Polyangia bacterium]
MSHSRTLGWLGSITAATVALSCGSPSPESDGANQESATSSALITASQRIDACKQDPRVKAGLVTARLCAGADIFFRESFAGNGRTCGSCHPASNNFTIDKQFIQTLPANDPLFVFETNAADLGDLENGNLRANGVIKENVDGFDDLANKFSSRGVPHLLSLKITLAPDPGDGLPNPPAQRTGWSGDGAPGTGSLRDFLTGAIIQHYPRHLARNAGVDFRLPTSDELDLTAEFQLSLGRTNELDFTQIRLTDAMADDGRLAYLDPQRGRCNVCHANGGANFLATGLNRNLDTGTRAAPFVGDQGAFDGGFGGLHQAAPNLDVFDILLPPGAPPNPPQSFGNGTFNTPPVIEAVDTPPFFHTNAFGDDIEGAISFYNNTGAPFFVNSPAGKMLEAQFGSQIHLSNDDIIHIGRALRVLNAALNVDIAKQRLNAAMTLINQFQNQATPKAIQLKLMTLASAEIDDALVDLVRAGSSPPLHADAQTRLNEAQTEIALGLQAADPSQRQNRVSNALARLQNARDVFGSNINFVLGQGNLLF